MVGDDGLVAVLDWEQRIGRPGRGSEFAAPPSVAHRRGREGPAGAGEAEPFLSYNELSGREVSMDDLFYWELAGNVRSAMGSVRQGVRHLSGEQPSIGLAVIGRPPARRSTRSSTSSRGLADAGPAELHQVADAVRYFLQTQVEPPGAGHLGRFATLVAINAPTTPRAGVRAGGRQPAGRGRAARRAARKQIDLRAGHRELMALVAALNGELSAMIDAAARQRAHWLISNTSAPRSSV